MKLSILICSTTSRFNNFLPLILNDLNRQLNVLTEADRREVEIITMIDNKSMSVGRKRNHLLEAATGEYVVFVDDDDRVTADYIKSLLIATDIKYDVITFIVSVSLNGKEPKPCYYSSSYEKDFNTPDSYHRLPNHIMCVRRDLAIETKFQDISFGEDADYARRLKSKINSEYNINQVLYYYLFDQRTSETQNKR